MKNVQKAATDQVSPNCSSSDTNRLIWRMFVSLCELWSTHNYCKAMLFISSSFLFFPETSKSETSWAVSLNEWSISCLGLIAKPFCVICTVLTTCLTTTVASDACLSSRWWLSSVIVSTACVRCGLWKEQKWSQRSSFSRAPSHWDSLWRKTALIWRMLLRSLWWDLSTTV